MKYSNLNRWRWIFLSMSLISFFMIGISVDITESAVSGIISFAFWALCCIGLLITFFYKRSSISAAIRKTLISSFFISVLVYLAVDYLFESSYVPDFIGATSIFTFYCSMILCLLIYIDKIEPILYGLIFTLVAGFILNRAGVQEGKFIIISSFLLSSLGFIYLSFRTLAVFRINRKAGTVLIMYYGVNAILNALLFLKFNEYRPAFFTVYDILGVVIFVAACLVLFIILPFSDFIEWPKPQKISFKRLVITPLVVFLLIFSLRYLLPDNTYKRIFFREYSEKKTYFDMKDYEVDFSKSN